MTPSVSDTATKVILDSISDGVFTVDHDFRILTFNRAAENITGYPKALAIGRYCWQVFHSDMCDKGCALKKTLHDGKTLSNRPTKIINRQGKTIPISVSTSLLKDTSGKILGGVETFRDKTVVEELRRELHGRNSVEGMISRSRAMQQIFSILHQVAESDSTVLVEGETGTGKELLCRAIHALSLRQKGKFVAINCGALPDTLLESELFGYKAGAFTGATHDKQGLFASAEAGTVLLDEIGDTSPAFQIKLLRLLEEKEYQPLGSVNTSKANVRILAATNKNLGKMVESGDFRQDLFYRINVIHLKLPLLRRREEDIPLLVEQFISKMNAAKGANVSGIAPEALDILMSHRYPGNIRELENIIEHAFVLQKDGLIEERHLPSYLLTTTANAQAPRTTITAAPSLVSSVHSKEREIITKALASNNYNRAKTARILGMHTTTLYRKIKKLKIDLPQMDGRYIVLSDQP